MSLLINCLVGFVAIQHVGFLVLEMFLFTQPIGLKIFRQTAEQAQISAVLAANQGLYNGFLAAGLVWALLHPAPDVATQLKMFFLGCVVVAGLYGAYSVSIKILIMQALPAAVTLALLILA